MVFSLGDAGSGHEEGEETRGEDGSSEQQKRKESSGTWSPNSSLRLVKRYS